MQTRKLVSLAALAGALVIAGCDSGGGGGGNHVAFKGTAATGAAIANADIVVRCTGATADITTTTTVNGTYTVTTNQMSTAGATLPCAVQVTLPDDSTLYSLAQANGVVNITPLTDLATAYAVNSSSGVDLATWFGDGSAAVTMPSSTDVEAAVTAVETALETATGEASVPFDVYSTAFRAGTADAYDEWLDALSTALTGASTTYADLLSTFVSGGGFGTVTIDVSAVTGGGTLTVTVTVSGYTNAPIVITGVPNPGTEGAFCGGGFDSYMGATGSVTIDSCSFSGNTGTLHATVHITSPYSMDIPYVATYTWS